MGKSALGTAQFGMDYGINNNRGKVPREEVFQILDEAFAAGIDTLDTASAYGESEQVLGGYRDIDKFKVISKLSASNEEEAERVLEKSFENLRMNKLYGYLIHNFKQYQENPEIYKVLEKEKADGKIKKIGFSLYFPYELEWLIDNKVNFDIVQIPYSIFDRRFEKYFPILKDRETEIYARSAFLQGLVFMNPDGFGGKFRLIGEKLENLRLMSKRLGISLVGLCLDFPLSNQNVDYVVVGVDGLNQFREIISILNLSEGLPRLNFDDFEMEDEDILLPFKWNDLVGTK